MMKKEKITVIVPAYNIEKYIARSLDSILNQTYQPIEIVAIDDGSTDGTPGILDDYAREHENIVVVHRKNGGVFTARLDALKKATGEWIGFVDGDDEIESDMYEFLMCNAVKYHADISHCGYQMVFEDGRTKFFYNTGSLVQQDRITGLKDLITGSFVEPGLCNKLFHKSLFHSLLHDSSMPTDIKINEDLLMNYMLFAQANKSVYEDQCKYHYLIRLGSASRSGLNWNKIFDPLRVRELICGMKIVGMEDFAKKSMLSSYINAYNALMLDHTKQFAKYEKNIYDKIAGQKGSAVLLGKKQRVLFYLLLHFPAVYRPVYNFYCKHIQKKKYE